MKWKEVRSLYRDKWIRIEAIKTYSNIKACI